MSYAVYIFIALVAVMILKLAWKSRHRRPQEDGFRFVYINQDGSARELVESERVYLETDFEGGDSGRPYVKWNYESKDGWGSISGFIERRQVPANVIIMEVVSADLPNEIVSMEVKIADAEAVGDIVVYAADGTVKITPNQENLKERFRILSERELQRQRCRENEVMTLLKKNPVEQGGDGDSEPAV